MRKCSRCNNSAEGDKVQGNYTAGSNTASNYTDSNKGAVVACGTWAGEEASQESRRLQFWNLQLCDGCLNQAFIDSQEASVASAYEGMQLAPFALAFGVLALYVLLDPENGADNGIEGMVIVLMLAGGYLFGVFGAWYSTWRFHQRRRQQRVQQTQPVPDAATLDAYYAEAERICEALVEQHQQEPAANSTNASQAIPSTYQLPMPKGVGEPSWDILGVAISRKELQKLIAQTDSNWRTALKIAGRYEES